MRWGVLFDIIKQSSILKQLEEEMSATGFWDNQESARHKVEQLKYAREIVLPYRKAHNEASDLIALAEIAEREKDERTVNDIARELDRMDTQVADLELCSYFSGTDDISDAFLNVHAGTGGTDACDWADMLLRMYSRYCDIQGWSAQLIDSLSGEEAGIRRATLYIKGHYVFGFLKSEIGVHRLVRLSPFDTNKKRHTSFAAVDVIPEIEAKEITTFAENELRIDTYSAGGPGGQHVNKTASAVRITHLPTGIVVQCQSQRSQHNNKNTAMKLLASKLNALAHKEQQDVFKKIYGAKGEIAWGYQIRSYVLHPYTLVKDHRTDFETGNINKVLDGEIGGFVKSFLTAKTQGAK
ncbi:MAG: peptide chain release factor 2 [Planctomycetota bacterium]